MLVRIMIDNFPFLIEFLLILVCVFTIVIFYISNSKPTKLILLIIVWSLIHSILAYNEFYRVIDTTPPRFALVIIPSFFAIVYGLLPKQRDWMLANRNLKISTFLHSVRLPVEIVLFYLYTYTMIPKLMTFEGRNFDILAGISAILTGILFVKQKIGLKPLLYWNYFGLILILFIFINGILAAETPIQQFAFEQPNKGMTYFPFILVPATIVPLVIYTHITDIIKIKNDLKK